MNQGFKTERVLELFRRGEATVKGRIRGDGEQASPALRHFFEHLAERFYDAAMTLADLERREVVDWRVREAFSAEMGRPIKRYLLECKRELACWLLTESRLQVRHVAGLLGYSLAFHFSRDFRQWTGESPADFRANHGRAMLKADDRPTIVRQLILSDLGIELPEEGKEASLYPPEVLCVFPGHACSEAAIQMVLEAVFAEAPTRHYQLLSQEFCMADPALFERLSRMSLEEGRRNRERGVDLALLALATAEASVKLPGGRARYVLALARVGNAQRLAGDLAGARTAFAYAEEFWAKVEESGRDGRVEAEMLGLLGSLRLFERRFAEAHELLDRSIRVAREVGDVPLLVSPLLQRVALNGYEGKPQEVLSDLEEVMRLLEAQAVPDRFLLLCVYQYQALAFVELQCLAEARRSLAQAASLCEALDHLPSRHQVQWTRGLVAQLDGEELAAERLFRQARAGFEQIGDRVTAALAALDLAILCHRQGRNGEVLEMVKCSLPILSELRLSREALVALQVLQSAVAEEAIPFHALLQARQALRQLLRDPSQAH